jgi:hypothetical protein
VTSAAKGTAATVEGGTAAVDLVVDGGVLVEVLVEGGVAAAADSGADRVESGIDVESDDAGALRAGRPAPLHALSVRRTSETKSRVRCQ